MVIACQSSNVKNLGLEGIVRDHANAKAFPTRTQLRCEQVFEKKGQLEGRK